MFGGRLVVLDVEVKKTSCGLVVWLLPSGFLYDSITFNFLLVSESEKARDINFTYFGYV